MSTPTTATVPGPAVPARELQIQSRLRFRATWALIKPYWKSEDRKAGLGLLLLLASDQSQFINGAVITADDGMV